MKIRSNRDGSKWLEITDALLLFKPYDKTKIIHWRADWKHKFCNIRFDIHKYGGNNNNWNKWNFKNLRCYIRLPMFYWEKHNNGWMFGTNNLYLWWHRARIKNKDMGEI